MAEKMSTALCSQCRQEIPAGAKLCTHCNSFQGWRGWLSVSNMTLALLTALIAVASNTVPSLYRLAHTPKSDAYLSTPSIEGTRLRVVALNHGDASAVFLSARIAGEFLAPATRVVLQNDADAVLKPGENLLIFDIVPLLTGEQSYVASIKIIETIIKKSPPPDISIVLGIEQSTGATRIFEYKLDADQAFELMRANSARCSAIEKPDFLNGCIGPGEIDYAD